MLSALLPAIAVLGGAFISSNANREAAQTGANAMLKGAQLQADTIREGHAMAQKTLNEIRAEAQPGTGYLQRVIADRGELTPTQLEQLEDLRRNTASQIRFSPYAGSGRVGADMFRKVESGFVNDALDRNRARAFDAARTFQSGATQAAGAVAGSQSRSGELVGQTMGQGVTGAGLTQAQGDLASAKVYGEALGTIGSLIANQQRESRYEAQRQADRDFLGRLYRV